MLFVNHLILKLLLKLKFLSFIIFYSDLFVIMLYLKRLKYFVAFIHNFYTFLQNLQQLKDLFDLLSFMLLCAKIDFDKPLSLIEKNKYYENFHLLY